MHRDQKPYRDLYNAILRYDGETLFAQVLTPWLSGNEPERIWLSELASQTIDSPPAMEIEDLWRLYALSRVFDLLQLSFTPPCTDGTGWTIARISPAEFVEFTTGLGLEPDIPTTFHPFFCEIVAVDQCADDTAPPALRAVRWPGLRLGSLLVARAGVDIAAGRSHVRKDIAEQSSLYWTYARNNRPATDLSDGWGSNSQWRTAFRRDYDIGGLLHYNVDGSGENEDDLTDAERHELLTHRCFVRCEKPNDDLWPYDDTFVEKR